MLITLEVRACPECGTDGRSMYEELRDRFFSVPGRWTVLSCEACRLLWLNPRPLASEMGKLYADYYTHVLVPPDSKRTRRRYMIKRSILASRFGYADGSPKSWMFALTGRVLGCLPWLSRRVERDILYLHADRRGRLLDIGAGNGAFLSEMKALGWTVAGLEPDSRAAQVARETLNCQVETGTIEEAAFQSDSFDAITLCHVIEHVPDPLAVFRRCKTLLKAGGTLVVATPNAAALGHSLLGGAWRELDPPRHLVVFTAETLKRCLERAGFTVERLVSSSRNANQIWATSRQIQKVGRMNPATVPFRLRMEGLVFRVTETVVQRFSRGTIGEEITLIARNTPAERLTSVSR